MNSSGIPRLLLVTWAVLLPLLLVIALIFSPSTFVAMVVAAAISPAVHWIVRVAYFERFEVRGTASSQIIGGR